MLTDERMSMKVDMILGDQTAATETNRSYMAFLLSLECAKNEYLTDKDQRATYYLGGICCLMPEVTEDLQKAVLSMGRKVRTISFPSAAARNGLIVPPKMVEPKKSNALFGFLVTMFYRNDIKSSDHYMDALFSIAGYDPLKGEDVSVFNDEDHSLYLRTTYGQNHEIRKAVLNGNLNHTKDGDSFGDVCFCLARILSWTDMTGFRSVADFLFTSPLIKAPELADEVKNFRKATKVAKNAKKPRFYMILENPENYSLFESSNFPTLTAVARKLKLNEEICKVDYFVAMHRIHLRGIPQDD